MPGGGELLRPTGASLLGGGGLENEGRREINSEREAAGIELGI